MNKAVILAGGSLLALLSTATFAQSELDDSHYRALAIKVGASRLKTDITRDKDFQLNGRALSIDYTSEKNHWTSNKDLYIGFLASLDIHYHSKKKSDTDVLYQVEEVSTVTFNLAPKISYMLTDRTALYGFAGASYANLKMQDFTKKPVKDSDKTSVSGLGYLWGVGLRYQLPNRFEFSGELRGNHNNVDGSIGDGKSDVYGLFAGIGYRF
ncbi:outer membrane beta-barrel protein [Vibrio sp. SCSIO 43136]|uniref:outer membrane protein n=1 Tax=Vibrio sp. SCSIO 43136 TaxID=2819101 RepID=UPI00207607DE|nr:outer membrane beta-barrel protein [Vibrio sp. SCSIO 43136]USD68186.1 porin family protein [Vibrio sp. SCSIO 43136]